ncbi:MAG: substrate-binding domain-containing protein [Chloroflexota bacterium]
MAQQISRRRFLQSTGAVASLGLLAACAAPLTTSDGGDGASADSINLIWDTFRGPGTGWNEERIDTFKEMHSNVSIEFRPLTGSSQQDNYGKMYAMHAAGDLGDLIAFDPSHYHFWRAINAGIIGPIQELADADDLDQSQWFEQFMVLQHYQGELYGLPSWGWAGHDTLIINKVHFDEAGIEPPDPTGHDTSMDTYAEWARSFYKEGERFGLAIPFGESNTAVTCRIWNSSLLNEDGTQCMIADDENAQAALRWLYGLTVEDGVIPSPGDVENNNSAQLEGKITMNWGGSLNARNFDRDIEDESIAVAWQGLFPEREDGRYPCQIRGGTWNMNAGTAHPQESFEFLKHITSFDGSLGFNLVAGQGALVRSDVVDELVAQNPIHEWFIPNLENGIPAHAPANSRGREYTDAVNQRLQLLLDANNPIAFEEGVMDLHNAIQEVLDKDPA